MVRSPEHDEIEKMPALRSWMGRRVGLKEGMARARAVADAQAEPFHACEAKDKLLFCVGVIGSQRPNDCACRTIFIKLKRDLAILP